MRQKEDKRVQIFKRLFKKKGFKPKKIKANGVTMYVLGEARPRCECDECRAFKVRKVVCSMLWFGHPPRNI